MRVGEIAKRYAKAIHDFSMENHSSERVAADLRAIKKLWEESPEIKEFFKSHFITLENKEKALREALVGKGVCDETVHLMMLLARKNRLEIFSEIVDAFELFMDEAHGVVRGGVRSAAVLVPEQRKKLESIIGSVTNKQVLLDYKEDPTLIGGLVAQVGSFTFDDTIESHLKRMNDDLKRRTH